MQRAGEPGLNRQRIANRAAVIYRNDLLRMDGRQVPRGPEIATLTGRKIGQRTHDFGFDMGITPPGTADMSTLVSMQPEPTLTADPERDRGVIGIAGTGRDRETFRPSPDREPDPAMRTILGRLQRRA